ncbi:unnamed protein product [Orchesella dallaii]|uniref:Uncharacterized protein n=1 Tax=Orchesella dallaii TaxID=48710 RepID=A0ABP1QKG4_9HEXA
MESLTSQIQHNVVDRELVEKWEAENNRLGSSSLTQAEADQKTCLKLPKLILEGYRDVLLSKMDKGNYRNANIPWAILTPAVEMTGNFTSLVASRELEAIHFPSFAALPEGEKSDYDNHEEFPAFLPD